MKKRWRYVCCKVAEWGHEEVYYSGCMSSLSVSRTLLVSSPILILIHNILFCGVVIVRSTSLGHYQDGNDRIQAKAIGQAERCAFGGDVDHR
jgi:hypothetical protein